MFFEIVVIILFIFLSALSFKEYLQLKDLEKHFEDEFSKLEVMIIENHNLISDIKIKNMEDEKKEKFKRYVNEDGFYNTRR